MDLVPDATALSSLVDLLGAVLQLAAAVVSLLAVATARGRRGRRDRDVQRFHNSGVRPSGDDAQHPCKSIR
ncbi:hypothetical protein [Micromonospora sp. NPDC049102]|uniref:hypothetical protein n=1 Tax=Micromonospora sp. NPDC049102 TaxID=3364265 RepID=UPI0037174726